MRCFPPRHSTRWSTLVARAARKHVVDGKPEQLYEPLDHIEPGLPRTLIHVSGSEVLLHDARVAAAQLAAAGVPTEVRVWPGQIHDFQLAAPLVPEATRSLRQIGEYIREATGYGRAAARRRAAAPETMYACGSRDTSVNSSEILHWFS